MQIYSVRCTNLCPRSREAAQRTRPIVASPCIIIIMSCLVRPGEPVAYTGAAGRAPRREVAAALGAEEKGLNGEPTGYRGWGWRWGGNKKANLDRRGSENAVERVKRHAEEHII